MNANRSTCECSTGPAHGFSASRPGLPLAFAASAAICNESLHNSYPSATPVQSARSSSSSPAASQPGNHHRRPPSPPPIHFFCSICRPPARPPPDSGPAFRPTRPPCCRRGAWLFSFFFSFFFLTRPDHIQNFFFFFFFLFYSHFAPYRAHRGEDSRYRSPASSNAASFPATSPPAWRLNALIILSANPAG